MVVNSRDEVVNLKDAMIYMKRTPSLFGVKMQQTWTGLFVFEKILRENPKIRSIVEIGSGAGALSLYLAQYMFFRRGKFVTVELQTGSEKVQTRRGLDLLKAATKGNISYRMGFDAWKPDAVKVLVVGARIGNEPMLVLCDGGNKKLEISLVAPHLRVGDILMGHDYGKEIDDTAVPSGWEKNPAWHPETEAMRALLLIMRKKG